MKCKRTCSLLAVALAALLAGCKAAPHGRVVTEQIDQSEPAEPAVPNSQPGVTVQGSQLLLDGEPLFVRGTVFEIFGPGEAPGSSDNVPDDLDFDYLVGQASALGANAIGTAFGGTEQMPQAYFEALAAHEMPLIMGLWFSGEANDWQGRHGDFQHPLFKAHVRELITSMVDRLHSGLGQDYSDQVLWYNLGNELAQWAIEQTNALHPDMPCYQGRFISAPAGCNASEAFLAEMADYLKSYEYDHYGVARPVTHTSWPVVSPHLLDTSFLDIVSYNLYSYWPEFVTAHAPGTVTGTPYQGALQALAAQAGNRPLVVSEVGLSTAPDSAMDNVGSEAEQSQELEARWLDISSAAENLAGGLVFELLDQWWKDDYLHAEAGNGQFSHHTTDSEEWFGLIELAGAPGSPEYRHKPAYGALQILWLTEESDSEVTGSE